MMSTPTGMSPTPASRISAAISSAWRFIRPNAGDTVPRRPISPALQFSGLSQGTNSLWCTAAEPKSHRIGSPSRVEQGPAAELVALPFADLGRRDVADVVDVEHQKRAQLGGLEGLLDAAEPIAMQPAVINPLLEIDAHGAERRQRATPIVARVDVLGANFPRLDVDLIHLILLSVPRGAPPPACGRL